MMKYQSWQTGPKRFRAMTGLDLLEFDELLPYFEEAHNHYFRYRTASGKPRSGQRTAVIYSNSPLPSLEERLAFILSYWKLNPIQEQHADMFSMTQKQCFDFTHGLGRILQSALKQSGVVPARNNKELQQV